VKFYNPSMIFANIYDRSELYCIYLIFDLLYKNWFLEIMFHVRHICCCFIFSTWYYFHCYHFLIMTKGGENINMHMCWLVDIIYCIILSCDFFIYILLCSIYLLYSAIFFIWITFFEYSYLKTIYVLKIALIYYYL